MSQKQRAKGEGSVYFDKSRGVYRAERRFTVDGVPQRIRTSGRTKSEALNALRKRVEEKERLLRSDDVVTVGDAMDRWRQRVAPRRMSPRTLELVDSLTKNHLSELGAIPLADLQVHHVERVLDRKGADGLATSTVRKLHSYLSQALDEAYRRRQIGWNPARVASIPPGELKAREGRALTPDEVRSLVAVTQKHRLGAWVEAALWLGLRPGEVSALTWSAINFDNGTMAIHQSLSWRKRVEGRGQEPFLKEPKASSVRTLAIPSPLAAALRRHEKSLNDERVVMDSEWPSEWRDLVFVSERGTPLDPPNVRRLVAQLAADAEIEGRVTPYDLRHTATSILSANNVPAESLADLLGHADTRMVFRHYRHPVLPAVTVAYEHMHEALGVQ